MKFWITRNSEIPLHEQLVRQVVLAIISEDLPAGHKLPSIRALARRYKIHSNTVSAAYHDLLNRGWLELRRGSGVYVRPLPASGSDPGDLDVLLADLLRTARGRGHEPSDVLHRLEQLISRREYARIAVAEPEPGMREILRAELEEHLQIPVEPMEPAALASIAKQDGYLVVSLPTRAAMVRDLLPPGVTFMILRLRSVGGSIEGQTRPAPNAVISIVSMSPDFRYWARAVLIAVGLDPECLCEIDATLSGWQDRATAGALVIADAVAARGLPSGCPAKTFRVIADSCIEEMKQLCRSV
jgi:DNA-binding transcriptional regulator YhcF (GntR family)